MPGRRDNYDYGLGTARPSCTLLQAGTSGTPDPHGGKPHLDGDPLRPALTLLIALLIAGCVADPVNTDSSLSSPTPAPEPDAQSELSDASGGVTKDKDARCLIRQNGVTTYSDACLFHLEKGGSFSIRRQDSRPILPNITDLSVTIVAAGVAEVRGLTTDGINSRWGSAVRSKVDSACWMGSDFEICAY